MKALSEHELLSIASELQFTAEHFPEGTLRFDIPGSGTPRDILPSAVSALVGSSAYLVGRERQPPLADTAYDHADAVAAALAQHRALRLDSPHELQLAVASLLRLGSWVGNDAYILDAAAQWMLYVSHHDTISLYERSA